MLPGAQKHKYKALSNQTSTYNVTTISTRSATNLLPFPKSSYFGLIQAGYRSLLKSMPSQPDPTRPENPTTHVPFDSPSTPTNADTSTTVEEYVPNTPKAPLSHVSSRGYGSLGLGTGASGVDDSVCGQRVYDGQPKAPACAGESFKEWRWRLSIISVHLRL